MEKKENHNEETKNTKKTPVETLGLKDTITRIKLIFYYVDGEGRGKNLS